MKIFKSNKILFHGRRVSLFLRYKEDKNGQIRMFQSMGGFFCALNKNPVLLDRIVNTKKHLR